MKEIKSTKDLKSGVVALCREYISFQENHAHLHTASLGYDQYNDILGALEAAKLEVVMSREWGSRESL